MSERERAAIDSLSVEDITPVFDLIGHDYAAEPLSQHVRWLATGDLDAGAGLFLLNLAERYPDQFLATLEQRIASLPSAVEVISLADSVPSIGPRICDLAAIRRCPTTDERELLKEQCASIGHRCCFSDIAFNPAWRTTDVTLLARGIYEEKAFDRMPILADALQDAGCDNEDLLTHCRDPQAQHVRGCWALDAVLGKE